MKKQLQGLSLILLAILFMLGYGNAPFLTCAFNGL